MRNTFLLLIALIIVTVSCRSDQIKGLRFVGEVTAKQILDVRFDMPERYMDPIYSWYMSSSPDGGWEKLEGIWSDQIVILTSYEGKYLMCEVSCRKKDSDVRIKDSVVTKRAVKVIGNSNTDWMRDAGFGKIQVNTPYCDYSSGGKMTIDEIPSSRWVEPGVQWFLFTYLGEKWGGKGSQFRTEDLVDKAKSIISKEGVLCLEVVVDATEEILQHHFEQIKHVGKALGKI